MTDTENTDSLDNEPDGEPKPSKKALYDKLYYREHCEELKARSRENKERKKREDPEKVREEKKQYMRIYRAKLKELKKSIII
jgi:hypothetical protein